MAMFNMIIQIVVKVLIWVISIYIVGKIILALVKNMFGDEKDDE